MSFVKGLKNVSLVLIAIGTSTVSANGFCQATEVPGQRQNQVKGGPAPSPAVERGPSNVDLVNKALKPGASDPDVPLPHPDLANPPPDRAISGATPQIFGRQEQGGGVFGLRVPIPADRNGSNGATRYSPDRLSLEAGPSGR
jgi:hypothetical protein